MTTKIYKTIPFALLLLFVFVPTLVSAHQPRIVESVATQVIDPEISKAYYATLTGSPHAGIVGLIYRAIWSPILIFFSGFALFEAVFSWCAFYAALGKNTCPIN